MTNPLKQLWGIKRIDGRTGSIHYTVDTSCSKARRDEVLRECRRLYPINTYEPVDFLEMPDDSTH